MLKLNTDILMCTVQKNNIGTQTITNYLIDYHFAYADLYKYWSETLCPFFKQYYDGSAMYVPNSLYSLMRVNQYRSIENSQLRGNYADSQLVFSISIPSHVSSILQTTVLPAGIIELNQLATGIDAHRAIYCKIIDQIVEFIMAFNCADLSHEFVDLQDPALL